MPQKYGSQEGRWLKPAALPGFTAPRGSRQVPGSPSDFPSTVTGVCLVAWNKVGSQTLSSHIAPARGSSRQLGGCVGRRGCAPHCTGVFTRLWANHRTSLWARPPARELKAGHCPLEPGAAQGAPGPPSSGVGLLITACWGAGSGGRES